MLHNELSLLYNCHSNKGGATNSEIGGGQCIVRWGGGGQYRKNNKTWKRWWVLDPYSSYGGAAPAL